MKRREESTITKKTEIFAHRGASEYAPENTIPAFKLAMEQGADGVELDVQMSADHQLVVIHDESIDRVSNGKGYVKDYTLKELRRFSYHNHMEKYGHVEIPTLREVLELLKPGKMKVNIELKTGIFWYPNIEEMVLNLVSELEMGECIIYSSFNHYSIQKIESMNPAAITAYLFSDVIVDVDHYAKRNRIKGLHPALYHVKMADFLETYLFSGLDVRVWTVNEETDMKLLMKAGVTAIITNKPDVALRVREEMKRHQSI